MPRDRSWKRVLWRILTWFDVFFSNQGFTLWNAEEWRMGWKECQWSGECVLHSTTTRFSLSKHHREPNENNQPLLPPSSVALFRCILQLPFEKWLRSRVLWNVHKMQFWWCDSIVIHHVQRIWVFSSTSRMVFRSTRITSSTTTSMIPAKPFDSRCCGSMHESIQISSSQFLECKALEPRKFNCTFLIESVWLKIVDKTAIEEDFAPCAHLFTNKYLNVA